MDKSDIATDYQTGPQESPAQASSPVPADARPEAHAPLLVETQTADPPAETDPADDRPEASRAAPWSPDEARRHGRPRQRPRPAATPSGGFRDQQNRPAKPPPAWNQIQALRMRRSVLLRIKAIIGGRPAETGGMLLSESRDYVVTDFVFDQSARSTGAAYNPDTAFLNQQLLGREDSFVGIVHSHPPTCTRLSDQDLRAAWSNLTSPGNPHLNAYLMPLVMTVPDTGRFTLLPFIVTCHPEGRGRVEVRAVDLDLVE